MICAPSLPLTIPSRPMQVVEYETGSAMARTHVCAECEGRLTVAWGGYFGIEDWVLRCVSDASHNGHRRIPSLRERWFAGERMSIHTENTLERKYGNRRDAMTKGADITTTLARVEQANAFGLFPTKTTPEQRRLLALVAQYYGLDPLLQEIIPYQGRPYITLEGRRRLDEAAGHRPSIHYRLLTAEETEYYVGKGALGSQDLASICILKDGDREVEAMGRVLSSERNGDKHLPLVKWPIEMLEKRGEYRARRRAYGPVQQPAGLRVTVQEGAIIEGEAVVLDPDSPATHPSPKTASSASARPRRCDIHSAWNGNLSDGYWGHPQDDGWCTGPFTATAIETSEPATTPPAEDLRTREELVQAVEQAGYKLADLTMVVNEDIEKFLAVRPIAEAFNALDDLVQRGKRGQPRIRA